MSFVLEAMSALYDGFAAIVFICVVKTVDAAAEETKSDDGGK